MASPIFVNIRDTPAVAHALFVSKPGEHVVFGGVTGPDMMVAWDAFIASQGQNYTIDLANKVMTRPGLTLRWVWECGISNGNDWFWLRQWDNIFFDDICYPPDNLIIACEIQSIAA